MNAANWADSPLVEPVQVPVIRFVGVAAAVTWHSAVRRCGAVFIQVDQACSTRAVRAAGNWREKTVTVGAGTVLKVKSVTMPPLPPPPPRNAHSRPELWL